jgi:hypothetical protein
MAAVASLPGLSQLLAWPTEHLTDAADHWEAVAERNYGLANQVWRDASSVDWQGNAADALRTATHSDMITVSAAADQLQTAAKVARSGASDLYAARSRLRYALEDAQTAGFDVDEEGSVVDRSAAGSAARRAARQAQAEALAADIRQRAAQLVAIDQQVAGNVTAAVAGIRDTFPQSPSLGTPPKDNRVQAVDRHWKQDPAPPPGPDADSPWKDLPSPRTMQDVRDALRQLRRGQNKPNRELDTPEEIRKFWEWLSKGAVGDLPPVGGFPRKVLEDGTEIRMRPDSDSGGPVVDVIPPGATKGPKVHLPLSPFVDDPPQPPLLLDHPPTAPTPPEPGHPLPAPLPPTRFADPADLPPWLKDPSPPGFQISPIQPPPVFEWDQPGSPAPPPVAQPTAPPAGGSWLPEIGHDLGEAGKSVFSWIVIGGALVGGIFGGQGGRVPAP